MRDNMLVNPSGREGHWMPIDLNIEHHIGYLKVCGITVMLSLIYLHPSQALFMAKGIYASWDRLGNLSAAINHIQTIKRQVIRTIAGYKGSTHTSPNTTNLVLLVAKKARDNKIQIPAASRAKSIKAVTDIRRVGHRKMETSTLATFNKKMHLTKTFGDMTELDEEEDELIVPEFTAEAEDDQIDALY